MPQPINKNIKHPPKEKPKETTKIGRIKKLKKRLRGNNEYGTSKLEEKFAHNFLDKLGIDYEYQWKAESIGRYFDFRLFPNYGGKKILLEVDGSYWHGDPRLYEENDLTKTQIRDKKIDKIKNEYCARNGYLLIRIWEYDINHNPSTVMKYLKTILSPYIDEVEQKKSNPLKQ